MHILGLLIIGFVLLLLLCLLFKNLTSAIPRFKEKQETLVSLTKCAEHAQKLLGYGNNTNDRSWDDFKEFVVESTTNSGKDSCSYVFKPKDAKPLPILKPGQFLTVNFTIPATQESIIRSYPISASIAGNQYRISCKNSLHLISDFTKIELLSSHEMVFIAFQSGISSVLEMANILASQKSDRPVWLFYQYPGQLDEIIKPQLESLIKSMPQRLKLYLYTGEISIDNKSEFSLPKDFDKNYFFNNGKMPLDIIQEKLEGRKCYYCIGGKSLEVLVMREILISREDVPKEDIFFDIPGAMYFHRDLQMDEAIDAKTPEGRHFWDGENAMIRGFGSSFPKIIEPLPVILIAFEEGIAPVLGFAMALSENSSLPKITLIYEINTLHDWAMEKELAELKKRLEKSIQIILVCNHPSLDNTNPQEIKDTSFADKIISNQELTCNVISEIIDVSNFFYYIAGAPGIVLMMKDDLMVWGVPERDIFCQGLGLLGEIISCSEWETLKNAETEITVTFETDDGNKEFKWDPQMSNLLTFADKNLNDDPRLERSCYKGVEGCCKVTLKSGSVFYKQQPKYNGLTNKDCLLCVGKPKGSITLDVRT